MAWRVPVLALPPARSASRHRPTPSRCHNPGRPHPTSRARISPIAATTAQRRPRRNHQTQNRQSPTPTTPRPTPRSPAPKPPPHPVNDMSPTRNPSSEPQKRQVLQISINNLIKRVKRTAFGFRRFANYRIRALLYAGKLMRVRIEVGSTGGGGSPTRAPPCGGGFPVECLPAGAGPVMSLDRSV